MSSFEITGEAVGGKKGGGSTPIASTEDLSQNQPVIHDLTSQFVGITADYNRNADEKQDEASVAPVNSPTLRASAPSIDAANNAKPAPATGWKSIRLIDPSEIEPRGGATIIEVDGTLVTFGGTDRDQRHFNDVSFLTNGVWAKKTTTGDVPTVRSGHAVAASGRLMFLFGGTDFAEEADYNDLYVLNIDTLRWSYVGEAGAEIKARNSHTMAVISKSGVSCLVIYGGASSTEGPLGDTIFAVLPTDGSIGTEAGFVTWTELTSGVNPGQREMHAFSSCGDSCFISGGRNNDGKLLDDVWRLTFSSAVEESPVTLSWVNETQTLRLPEPRCSHGMAIMPNSSVAIFGGFIGNAIGGDVLLLNISKESSEKKRWNKLAMSNNIPSRFGLTMCSASASVVSSFRDGSYLTNAKPKTSKLETYIPPAQLRAQQRAANNRRVAGPSANAVVSGDNKPTVTPEDTAVPVNCVGFAVFGGVSVEDDFGDLWVSYCDL